MSAALLALLLAAAPARAAAPAKEAAPAPEAGPIQEYYEAALAYYTKGDYRRAVGKWNEVLKVDPSQKSAQTMVADARRRIEKLTRRRREKTFALIGAGRYEAARLEIQALLDQDPSDPQINALQTRLESVVKVAPELAPEGKPARTAVVGLSGYLALPQNLPLAYDALRYAVELAPGDPRWKSFLDLVLDERPELGEDAVAPGMRLIPYLQMVAVHDIYDAKYHHAVGVLGRVLALEPDDVLALKRLGSAYYSLGDRKRARAAWERALRLQPGDATLKRFLARLGAASGKQAP